MATLKDAFNIARTLLDDDIGLTWTDQVLMNKVALAHKEMMSKLVLNGLKPTRKDTDGIAVAIGAVTIATPTDLAQPIKMSERLSGEPLENAFPMTEKEFLTERAQWETLVEWSFNGQTFAFIGATTARTVHLYYDAYSAAPTSVNTTLPIVLSETYLGPRIVAFCALKSDRELAKMAMEMAEENLSKIVRTAVKSDQIPVRRKPFSARNGRRRRIF